MSPGGSLKALDSCGVVFGRKCIPGVACIQYCWLACSAGQTWLTPGVSCWHEVAAHNDVTSCYSAEGSGYQNGYLCCRRLALSALHFAGSRTLSLDEEDPFHSASGLSRTSHAAYCAYDPAFVVPAAAAMLQQGWVAAESVVRAGWMPLLLRCLGADDDRLRCASIAIFTI